MNKWCNTEPCTISLIELFFLFFRVFRRHLPTESWIETTPDPNRGWNIGRGGRLTRERARLGVVTAAGSLNGPDNETVTHQLYTSGAPTSLKLHLTKYTWKVQLMSRFRVNLNFRYSNLRYNSNKIYTGLIKVKKEIVSYDGTRSAPLNKPY